VHYESIRYAEGKPRTLVVQDLWIGYSCMLVDGRQHTACRLYAKQEMPLANSCINFKHGTTM
jgi:hypothetical protein